MSEQIEQARADGRSALTEPEGKALAAQFGLAVPQSVLVSPKEDLRAQRSRYVAALCREGRLARYPAQE